MAKYSATKTTRNKDFNWYEVTKATETLGATRAYVTSVIANTKAKKNAFQNIKLLGIEDGIKKTGSEIYADAFNNTTMIEINTNLPAELAKYAATFSVSGRPEDEELAQLYDKIKQLLEYNLISYDNIKNNMIINYSDLNNTNDYYIFGAPEKFVLNNRQNYNNCGIESTLNTLAMAGIITMNENLKDQKSVEKKFLNYMVERGLANDDGEIGVLDEADGGTLPDDYRDILKYYGINSTAYYMSNKADENVYSDINDFAYKISQGHGAVVGVCSSYLWNETQSETGQIRIDHAIAITGVVYATPNPSATDTPVGFYIHDSGAWMTRFITLDDFKKATLYEYQGVDEGAENYNKNLREYDTRFGKYIGKDPNGFFTTITDDPIKTNTFNLNATGDKYANIIEGNSGNNIIKGMNGNDTLYGNNGNDEIRGANGDDIIVGNEAYSLKMDETEIFNTVEYLEQYVKKSGKDFSYDQSKKLDNLYLKSYSLTDNVQTGINNLYGDAGNDIIIGGDCADLIYSGNGHDYIYGGDGRNAIYAGAGNDVLIGGWDNDRLFGDAGNDYIYGLDDDDTIDGGNGNDHIFGGYGDDRIETGKGNDTVYFEGQNHGCDTISSKAGTTMFKFEDIPVTDEEDIKGKKASDMFFKLNDNDNSKTLSDLKIGYTVQNDSDIEGIKFLNFFNKKNGKYSSITMEDANNDIYTLSVSKKSKASVANTKTEGTTNINGERIDNSYINNILISTNTTGTNILTSYKNDIVTMAGTNDKYDKTYDDEKIVDTIFYGDMNKIGYKRPDDFQYAGGYDKYISEERNTKYVVDFSENTTLSIYDNVVGLTKIDDDYQEIKNAVSTHDNLQLMSDFGHVEFFFDVAINGDEKPVTTDNNQLFVLYKDYYSGSDSVAKHTQIANNRENSQGFVYMDTFFGAKDTIIAAGTGEIPEYNFFGNGRIETLLLDVEEKTQPYSAFESDIVAIANDVAGWLSTNEYGYTSAFEAFANATKDSANIQGLIDVYINGHRPTDG